MNCASGNDGIGKKTEVNSGKIDSARLPPSCNEEQFIITNTMTDDGTEGGQKILNVRQYSSNWIHNNV